MAYLEGENRYQSSFVLRSLDEQIDDNNPVRVIDAYVDSVDLIELGFKQYSGNLLNWFWKKNSIALLTVKCLIHMKKESLEKSIMTVSSH